jgi:hypothetical protein
MISSSSRVSVAIVNIVGLAAVVVVNALATTIPLGGMTTGALSDLYPNLFVPAGLTFAIWGVIYLLLGIFVVYSLIFSARKAEPGNSFIEKVGVLFAVTCAANIGWIFSWQYRVLPLSLMCMIILLLSLITIYNRLNIGRSRAAASEKYLVHLPMSIYLGWISIATITNVTALLVYYKWDRFGIDEQIWTVIMIAIGILLGVITLFYRRDIFYALVVDWAVLGILLKRMAVDPSSTQGVIIASIVGMCVLTLSVIVQIGRRKVYRMA